MTEPFAPAPCRSHFLRHLLTLAAYICIFTLANAGTSVWPAAKTVGSQRCVYQLLIVSDGNWTITSDSDWVSFSGSLGSYETNLQVTIQPNPNSAPRTAIISVANARQTVTQLGAGSSTNELWAVGDDRYGELGDSQLVQRTIPTPVANGVRSVAAGDLFTLYLKNDGTLWATGDNSAGQLGDGTTTNRSSAAQVATNVQAIAGGYAYSMFLKTDGTVWAVGDNTYGQLGDGTVTSRLTPVQIASGVQAIASRGYHSLFLKTDGTLWAAGRNTYGEIGDGTTTSRSSPVQVATNVQSMAAGLYHTLFVKLDGTLWAMGNNVYGQLGDGSTSNRSLPVQVASGVKAVSAGYYFTMIVKADGTLWTFGRNSNGQLGDTSTIDRSSPVRIAANVQWAAAGNAHAIYLTQDGALWTMGYNSYSQIGDGGFTDRSTPFQVGTGYKAAAAGTKHTLLIRNDDTLMGCGYTGDGALGISLTTKQRFPTQVDADVKAVAAGSEHTLVLKTDGTLLAFGRNSNGELGDNSRLSRSLPFVVATDVKQIAGGNSHSLFLKTDGTLWGMGWNAYNQLGDGSGTDQGAAIQIASQVQTMAAGMGHTLFVKNDATLWAMGLNTSGQLGDSTTISRSTPVQVMTGVKAVAAGDQHSLVLKTDGTLWAMGDNSNNQLGDGTKTNRTTPIQITTEVIAIAAGAQESMFIKSDTSLWAVGNIYFSKLSSGGISGSLINSTAPVSITTGVVAVAASNAHFLYLKNDGTLWGAGNSDYGQLMEPAGAVLIPQQIADHVSSFSAGRNSSYWVSEGYVAPWISLVTSPSNAIVAVGQSATFAAQAVGAPSIRYGWSKNGIVIANANSASYTLASATMADAGIYTCTVGNSLVFTFLQATLTVVGPGMAPVITGSPTAQVVATDDTATFSVTAVSTDPVSYQWRHNGVPIAGATGATLSIANPTKSDLGAYDVVVSNAGGSATSSATTLSYVASRLTNVSIRSNAGVGDQTLVVGFGMTGTGQKQLLLRGIGPTLSLFNVSGVLDDPQLILFDSATQPIQQNDDWGTAGLASDVFSRCGAFGLPAGSKDAALYLPLNVGTYTAHITSKAGTGIALLEAFDSDARSSSSQLINVSGRTLAGTGDNILIVGFAIRGGAPKTLLIRGVGPSLAQFGISDYLADPELQLYLQQGALLAENNDWGGTAALSTAFAKVRAFDLPMNSKDAAMIVTLDPGNYTAEVRGADGGTGIAMVEVYDLQ